MSTGGDQYTSEDAFKDCKFDIYLPYVDIFCEFCVLMVMHMRYNYSIIHSYIFSSTLGLSYRVFDLGVTTMGVLSSLFTALVYLTVKCSLFNFHHLLLVSPPIYDLRPQHF